MGRIVVSEFVTLDGVMEDPGGSEGFEHGGWAFTFERGADGDRFKLDELLAAEALLLGRVTYEGFAAAWPSRTDEAGFADKMNSMPKVVVSTTLEQPGWNNTTVIAGNVPEELAKLRDRIEGDILVAGSAQLVNTLAEHDLVDEYRLMVFPTLLGSGKRLFRDGVGTSAWTIVETKESGQVVMLTLRRAES
jgi:dihydrofolate reductase